VGGESDLARRRAPRLWRLRGSLTRKQYWAFALLGLIIPLVVWEVVAAIGAVEKIFLPSPGDVLSRFYVWLTEEDLLQDIWISVYRVTLGFLLSALIALPLGVWIGTYAPVRAFFEPLTDFIRYMPAVAFIPLVMIWFGVDEGAKVAIIFIGTFFQMVLMVAEDVRGVPETQIETAQAMGGSNLEILWHVVWPSAKPAIMDTMRVTMGWAWTYLVVAELVAANSGLGFSILRAQRFLHTDQIFVGIALIGLIGLVIDQLFRFAHRKQFPWLYFRNL
jgi:NitT/TauT family transport system permease protein